MSLYEVDLPEVQRATIGAVGEPGARVFLLQAQHAGEQFTFVIEKTHALSFGQADRAMAIQLGPPKRTQGPGEVAMELDATQEPLWRVGQIDLNYDNDTNKVNMVLHEATPEETQGRSARIALSRGEFSSMAQKGIEVASQGRPVCPQCGNPMDPDGHWCVASNGHKEISM